LKQNLIEGKITKLQKEKENYYINHNSAGSNNRRRKGEEKTPICPC
jgi:hypothetical protein